MKWKSKNISKQRNWHELISIKKSLYRNLNRSMNRQRQEYEEETSGANVQAAFRENELQRENNLARELDKIKREEIRNVRLRQQIRENSQELREVERKLRAAYINKALTAQIAQKEAERQNEKIQEQKAYEILRHARIEEAELKKKLKQEDINKKANYLKELQDQMILKEKSKRYLYEEFLREKKDAGRYYTKNA
ncbi:hypothetical protein NQ317_006405 [Molorchus minor]|uniref:Meiosis-specific nuclear structural protein 1 n=1 Tax=Molorchus minor TaxID=1323400 RepID=A0ABQ9JNY2_9CUCU|nr:hypothetical protein NQ317_006405 [Molorchus minor]